MRQVVRFVFVTAAAFGPFAACHSAMAADPPRAATPTVDVEVEDRAPDKSSHVTRFALSLVDGHAKVAASDNDSRYEVEASAFAASEPQYLIKVSRHARDNAGEMALSAAIPQRAGPRVLVAKIDRADGHVTLVVAQIR